MRDLPSEQLRRVKTESLALDTESMMHRKELELTRNTFGTSSIEYKEKLRDLQRKQAFKGGGGAAAVSDVKESKRRSDGRVATTATARGSDHFHLEPGSKRGTWVETMETKEGSFEEISKEKKRAELRQTARHEFVPYNMTSPGVAMPGWI